MIDSASNKGQPRPADGRALARARARLERAPEAPWLHRECAQRMVERLPLFKQQPADVLDWWPRAGASLAALQAALPSARLHLLSDLGHGAAVSSDAWGVAGVAKAKPGLAAAEPPAQQAISETGSGVAATWLARFKAWRKHAPTAVSKLPPEYANPEAIPEASVQLLWANMLLHHFEQPAALFLQWHRALAVDGVLMFSTLGPGSLGALRGLYRRQGWGEPMAELVDMHDWGDMLVEAGFADPVMDQEVVKLSWSTPELALAELQTLGANAHRARQAGLRTPRWRAALLAGLGPSGRSEEQPDRVELEFELVYGHAFKAAPRLPVEAETRIGVDTLRHALRSTRSMRKPDAAR